MFIIYFIIVGFFDIIFLFYVSIFFLFIFVSFVVEGDFAENVSYYVQGGPALVSVDGEEMETEYSGKAGVGLDITERLNVYGEVSFLTEDQVFEDDLNVGAKAGVKFTF